jgi:hypothetical protein
MRLSPGLLAPAWSAAFMPALAQQAPLPPKTFISASEIQELTAGAMMFVPQATPHQIRPTGGEPCITITLRVPRAGETSP